MFVMDSGTAEDLVDGFLGSQVSNYFPTTDGQCGSERTIDVVTRYLMPELSASNMFTHDYIIPKTVFVTVMQDARTHFTSSSYGRSRGSFWYV